MNGYIYKITNKINNKIYIGQTILNVKDRWNLHCWKATNQNSDNMAIKKVIKKYGRNNFIFEIIETCEETKLNEREIYWISYYDSYNKGYNLTLGGSGSYRNSKLYNYLNDIIELYNYGFSLREIAKNYNVDKHTVELILLKNNISIRKIRIYKFSEIDKLQIIKEFDSGISRKELINKYNISKSYLSKVLNQDRIKYFQECPNPNVD